MACASQFYTLLFMDAQPHHARLRAEGNVDDDEAIRQRMVLGAIAVRARAVFHKLEAATRGPAR